MKKILITIITTLFSVVLLAQEPTQIPAGGTWSTARGIINTNATQVYDSLASHNAKLYLKSPLLNPVFSGIVRLASDTLATRAYARLVAGTGGSMTYPGVGIPLSSGTAWAASITNNSANWNTAYGWGNHASGGYAPLANPNFTGTPRLATADTLATRSYARGYGGSGTLSASDTASMLTPYSTMIEVSNLINDSLTFRINGAELAISLQDSTGILEGNYMPRLQVANLVNDSLNVLRSAGIGSTVDSSLYVTVTRLTDSLSVMRGLINQLIASVEALGIDVTAPAFSSARISADTLYITMNKNDIHQDSIPLHTAFELTENSNIYGTTSISISDSLLIFKLDSIGRVGATYLVDYTKAFPALQDSSGNEVASWSNRSVTNDVIAVTGINVLGTGGATTISTDNGTLQMLADVSPNTAADTTITWSAINGTGTGTISTGGLLTAVTDGTVTARATANDGSAVYGDEVITLSNQVSPPANMLTNGELTGGTSWNTNIGWTFVNDAATWDDISAGSIWQLPADMVTNTVANTAYTLTFDVSGTTGGGIYMVIYGSDNGEGGAMYVVGAEYNNGSKTVNFTTPADVLGGGLLLYCLTAADSGGTIDNIVLIVTP